MRKYVLRRDGHKCVRCLRERVAYNRKTKRAERVLLTIDHILRRAEGGISHPDNLRVLCWPCHDQHNRGVW